MLRTEGLSFAINERVLLQPTDLQFEAGRFHVIMGANGAGKSTLLKLLAAELKPTAGKVFLADRPLDTYDALTLARRRAVLSQHYAISFPIPVGELVMMGRYPHFGTRPSEKDQAICREAMRKMDVMELADRDYGTLSGGEAQKVQMSRVLAQIWEGEGNLLFLDEPVSHLDVKFQYELLRLAKERCAGGATVVAILHDINLALVFADRLLLMKKGAITYDLAQPDTITADIMLDIFGIRASIIPMANRRPVIVFGGG